MSEQIFPTEIVQTARGGGEIVWRWESNYGQHRGLVWTPETPGSLTGQVRHQSSTDFHGHMWRTTGTTGPCDIARALELARGEHRATLPVYVDKRGRKVNV